MKLQSLTCFGFTLIILSCPLVTFAEMQTEEIPTDELIIETKNVFVPESHYLPQYEKNFSFDWNNYATIANNKDKVAETELFLKKINHYEQLNDANKQQLGMLFYKLGTYYTHISHEPDLAIMKMQLAETLLTSKKDKAWNYDHLAYAYEQKYAQSEASQDKEKALYYINKVANLYPQTQNIEVAFAYYVQGQLQQDDDDYAAAETSFNHALAIYNQRTNKKDDQYIRIKNELAMTILEQDGRDKEALEMLETLKKQWALKGDLSQNPYAAKNFLALGQAYLKEGDIKAAHDAFQQAITIYETIYGKESALLIEPYQLLSDIYDKLGDAKLAATYEKKASLIKKG